MFRLHEDSFRRRKMHVCDVVEKGEQFDDEFIVLWNGVALQCAHCNMPASVKLSET